jgi:outer membrane protein
MTLQGLRPLLAGLALAHALQAGAFNESRQLDPEDRSGNWSVGVAYSWLDSVYAGEDFRRDFMPTFVYTGERFFIDTTDFGWHAVDNDRWQVDVFGSYFISAYNDHTFFSETGEVRDEDDPLKGMERSNAFEAAAEITRKTDLGRFSLELRHDVNGVHDGGDIRARWARVYRHERWQLEPWIEYQWLSSEKADYYFGVREDEATDLRPAYALGDAASWAAGIAARYRFWDRHHLALNLSYRDFGSDITSSPIVVDSTDPRVQFTYRYEIGDPRVPRDAADPYNFFTNNGNATSLRLAYGCTTETKFNTIVRGSIDCGNIGTTMASVFVGRRLTDRLLGLPLEGWIHAGLARRRQGDFQDDFFEAVMAFKALYRRFPWSDSVETRIGIGHGLSYADSIPALEQQKAIDRNRRTSRLLNYLEFSLDVSVGDVFRSKRLESMYFGFAVHHRSGVFASSDLFDNTYGGSNVNMLYLEWEFGGGS